MISGSRTFLPQQRQSTPTYTAAPSTTGWCFDAVRVRLIEIGEAVRAIAPDLLALEPKIAWVDVAGMRNHLAHRYFDTAHAIVQATIDHDLPPLVAAVERLLEHRSAPDEA